MRPQELQRGGAGGSRADRRLTRCARYPSGGGASVARFVLLVLHGSFTNRRAPELGWGTSPDTAAAAIRFEWGHRKHHATTADLHLKVGDQQKENPMAITSSFQTEVATMETAARRVDEVANSIEAQLRDLDNRIQPITSSWRGAAASAYLALHQRWTEDATKLRQVLAEISLGVSQNASRYQVNEDDVASQMVRTTGQL